MFLQTTEVVIKVYKVFSPAKRDFIKFIHKHKYKFINFVIIFVKKQNHFVLFSNSLLYDKLMLKSM